MYVSNLFLCQPRSAVPGKRRLGGGGRSPSVVELFEDGRGEVLADVLGDRLGVVREGGG